MMQTETRRTFLKQAGAALAAGGLLRADAAVVEPALAQAVAQRPYLTAPEGFRTFVREKPPVDQFSPEKLREAGLTRETWRLEVVADPGSNAQVERPLSREAGTALNWADLMSLGEKHAVRFLHVLTCTNMPEPFGMGLWEGVPLREVVWLARPKGNVRRLTYWGYHNENLKAGQPVELTGVAQVGLSGLGKVQYSLEPADRVWPAEDPYFTKADWREGRIAPPPEHWGGGLPDGKLPEIPLQFDPLTGQPRSWPLRYTLAQWVASLQAPAPGTYHLRCRTLDAQGQAQPMPRPFPKSGNNAIQTVTLEVA